MGIKTADFARSVYVSESHLGNIERSAMRVSFETLARIANRLSCQIEELIDLAGSRPTSPRPPTHPRPTHPPRVELDRVPAA